MGAPLKAAEEVFAQVELLLSEQMMCQETHEKVSYNSNEADDCSEGHISLAGAGHDGPEADCPGQIHLGVSTQEPQQQREEERGDAAVCVALLEKEHQRQLAKHDYKHEVAAKHAETQNVLK